MCVFSFQTVMEKFRDSVISHVISDLMKSKNERLFGTWKVRELLWGYEDPLLKELHAIYPILDPNFGLFYKVAWSVGGVTYYWRIFIFITATLSKWQLLKIMYE